MDVDLPDTHCTKDLVNFSIRRSLWRSSPPPFDADQYPSLGGSL